MFTSKIAMAVAMAAAAAIESKNHAYEGQSHNMVHRPKQRLRCHNGGRPAVPVSTRRKANKAARKARRAGK